ncbi:MAG TPA: nickel-dependent lactate racemase [Verrucomicrobiae bacterium]|nr:nickel-dependent lactate racemase [Verrucomicrobiae bacterium]
MIRLRYGTTAFTMAAEEVSSVVSPPAVAPAAPPQELVGAALDGCREQLARFRRGERVVVVVSDITRYTASEVFLPILLERLTQTGISPEDVTLLVALGIHRKQTPEEHAALAGPLYGRVRIVDHDCDDGQGMVTLGVTSGGVPVEVNRLAVEADRLILTGAVGFHYFAGFSGGRKSLLPGIASRRSCMASHFMVLNPSEGSGKNPRAATGVLEGNPVHRAMEEACAMAPPDFILNTVVSADKRLLACFAGDWREAHARGCEFYRSSFCCPVETAADLVVVSCGGWPKDINVIQAHKSMEYGARALRPGGVMILLAECRDGHGNPTFYDWFSHAGLAELESSLRRRYEINGQTAYSLLEKALRYRIIFVSSLPAAQVEGMRMLPARSLEEALDLARPMLPPSPRVTVIPEGGSVLPVA